MPWALVILPLGPAVALAFVTAALPVAAAALSVLHRPDPAAQLRRGRTRTLRQRLRAAWVTLTGAGAAATVALGLLVFAAILASLAIPREGVALRTGALQRVIAASPPAERTVVGTVARRAWGETSRCRPAPSRRSAPLCGRRWRRADAGRPRLAPLAGPDHRLRTVQGAAPVAGYGPPQLELAYSTALARYSRIVAGRLQAGGGEQGQSVVQVAVTTATTARYGLRVGTRLRVGLEPVMPVLVTGIIEPVDPAAVCWTQHHVAASPVLTPGSSAGCRTGSARSSSTPVSSRWSNSISIRPRCR